MDDVSTSATGQVPVDAGVKLARCGKLCNPGKCERCDAVRRYVAESTPRRTLDDNDAYRHRYFGPKDARGRSTRAKIAGIDQEDE